MKNIKSIIIAIAVITLQSCGVYQNSWVKPHELNESRAYPEALKNQLHSSKVLSLPLVSPGRDYKYDVGEKDPFYDHESGNFVLDSIFIKFKNFTSSGKLLADIDITDKKGNKFSTQNFDLLRLVHKYDTNNETLFAENIEEEYNRYGYTLRRWFDEFNVSNNGDSQVGAILDRVVKLSITNNCLDATKWEIWIGTEDFSDWDSRKKGSININHQKTLSHSWFHMDRNVYTELVKMKNPAEPHDYPSLDYEKATVEAQKVKIDFDALKHRVKKSYTPKMVEVGHKSNRVLEPVDKEEHYKWEYGLFINKQDFTNYSNILERPVKLGRFQDMGFYDTDNPNIYDYSFLKGLDKVEMNKLETGTFETYYEIRLTGDHATHEVVLGNVDISQLNHLKMRGYLFGFNTYPKGRRYNPGQNTSNYDADSYPDKKIHPYLIMIDKASGKYLNNQKKGVEKLYIGYDQSDNETLQIYLLSYERITPVWMSKFKVPMEVFQSVKNRKNLF